MDTNDAVNNESKKEKLNVLMEEYRQLYEHARHDDDIASKKEAIFATVSFSILAYTVTAREDLIPLQIIAVGLSSITIYLYHIFSCERMAFCYCVRYRRIREIEEKVNLLCGEDVLCFQRKREEYERQEKKERHKNRKCFHWISPHHWFMALAEYIGIRPMRLAMTVILILLWLIVFCTSHRMSTPNNGTDPNKSMQLLVFVRNRDTPSGCKLPHPPLQLKLVGII